ncbi:hypothetical protein H6F32_16900 [Anabaena sp. FACHB-1237]|uniref:tellurite resistance TerB C-terminal domain-containing protein n=1 Tax=Anabaena sp. FACHB-1237 TaxID=2692769 RepID=UPI001680AE96|nr:tellurite resistance TerB C-terminal domain-containing protein [Anabaena sp. FACHB-1237]MBD2139209.1 hypothetical protein [Anabaena sp. FACHB-1237]
MTLITNNSNSSQLVKIKPQRNPSSSVNYQFLLGIAAFSTSFGLSLIPNWDFSKAFFTAIITVLATYSSAFFVDKRRRNNELKIIGSLHKHIRDLEGLKYRIFREVKQLEEYQTVLYSETQKLENKITQCRSQRDRLHRDIGNYAAHKKKIELEVNSLTNEFHNLEKSNSELTNSYNNLIAEKRRIEMNYNVCRTELSQIQTQIEILKPEKEKLEVDVTLLERIKPQLEEKLYELRLENQKLELEVGHQKELLLDTNKTHKNLEQSLSNLQNQAIDKQVEINQLQNQVSILRTEHDLLQNQIWELLQQIETLETIDHAVTITSAIASDITKENIEEENLGLFPFDEILETYDQDNELANHSDHLGIEWQNFLGKISQDHIVILTAIATEQNPQTTIKKIAEKNITMPNLLIDDINEIAHNTLGEIIIEINNEIPKISSEYLLKVQKMI